MSLRVISTASSLLSFRPSEASGEIRNSRYFIISNMIRLAQEDRETDCHDQFVNWSRNDKRRTDFSTSQQMLLRSK